jgi:endoglucanase
LWCASHTDYVKTKKKEVVVTLRHSYLARFALAILIASLLSACPLEQVSLDDYPPMANDHPPGASADAIVTAAALGRGVNIDRMFEWTTVGANFPVADQLIAKAKEAGFTSIRLPIRWSSHAEATSPYTIDPTFFAQVESVVDQALAADFYVIVNMHHHRQLDGDLLDVGESAVADDVVDVRYLTMWKQIAKRFKSKSDHLLFELYNEPHGRLVDTKWNELVARAMTAVRQTNPHRIVVIGSTVWNTAGALAGLRVPNDANLIVTVHNYEPFYFTHQGAAWVSPVFPTGITCCTPQQQSEITAPLNTAKTWSDTNQYPIFVGEFGAYSAGAMESRVNFTRYMRDQAEARDMSWTYWEFSSSFGVYDIATDTWHTELLNALLGN